jgi:hypothetical protein
MASRPAVGATVIVKSNDSVSGGRKRASVTVEQVITLKLKRGTIESVLVFGDQRTGERHMGQAGKRQG